MFKQNLKVVSRVVLSIFLLFIFFQEVKADDLEQLAKDAGLSKITLTKSQDKLTLPLQIIAESRCTFGDFDAIYFDARYSKFPLVLSSFETISEKKSQTLDVLNISQKSLDFVNLAMSEQGFNHQFNLSAVSEPTVVGVYLCLDSKQEGKCSTKPFYDVNAVLDNYSIKKVLPKNYSAADKTYFFSFLVMDKGEIYFPTSAYSKEQYDALGKFFTAKIGNKGTNSLEKIKKLNHVLASMPLSSVKVNNTQEDAIRISLPKINPTKCFKQADNNR